MAHSYLNKLLKRGIDILVVFPMTILLTPILLLILIAIRWESAGNPIFVQQRIGRDGNPFNLYKFRTMRAENEGKVILGKETFSGDPRVTKVGHYLRRFKVDELPQLFNVLFGHMSLVGPRPDIPEQVDAYTPFQLQRLNVRPGLTGVVQVSGNIWMPWSERIQLDVWYIENWSLLLDFKLLAETVKTIMTGELPEADPFGLRATMFGLGQATSFAIERE